MLNGDETPSYLVHHEFSQEQEAVASPGGHGDSELDGHPLHGEEAQVLQLQGRRTEMCPGCWRPARWGRTG